MGIIVKLLYNISIISYYYMSIIYSYLINLLSSYFYQNFLFTDKLDLKLDLDFESSSNSRRLFFIMGRAYITLRHV